MKIAVDLHGGDRAPEMVFRAIQLAIRNGFVEPEQLIAVGTGLTIRHLRRHFGLKKIEGFEATDVVDMGEPITSALRKRESSIAKGISGIKNGDFQGFVSAGNTAAIVSAGVAILGRLKSNLKPAIAVPIPNSTGPCLLLDAGASASNIGIFDLLHFAKMGKIYAQIIWDIPDPKVALLNIGSEVGKGDQLLRDAHDLLGQDDSLNFIGNTEGDRILKDDINVVVCPGIVGNQLLKFGEGVVELISEQLGFIWKVVKFLSRFTKHAEYQTIGGAPLLGVSGNIFIAHGKSSPIVLANAIRTAAKGIELDVNNAIAAEINNKTLSK